MLVLEQQNVLAMLSEKRMFRYDLTQKKMLRSLGIRGSQMVASRDNSLIATRSYRGDGVAIWNAETGAKLREWTKLGECADLDLSPDGGYLVVAIEKLNKEGAYHVWGWDRQREEYLRLQDAQPSASAISIAPDGQHVAAGDGEGNLRIWRLDNGQLEGVRRRHAAAIIQVEYSADGTKLLTTAEGEGSRLWNANSLEVIRSLPNAIGKLTRFSRTGKAVLSTGSRSNDTGLTTSSLDDTTSTTLTTWGSYDSVFCEMPGSRFVAMVKWKSGKGARRVWAVGIHNSEIDESFRMDLPIGGEVVPSSDGRKFAVLTYDKSYDYPSINQISVYDVESKQLNLRWRERCNRVTFPPGRSDQLILGFAPWGDLAKKRPTDYYGLQLWDLQKKRRTRGYQHSRLQASTEEIACSADGGKILFSPVGILDHEKLSPVPWSKDGVRGFIDENHVLIGGAVHRISDGQELYKLGEEHRRSALSGDGSTLMSVDGDRLTVWDTRSGVKLHELQNEQDVDCLSISPNGRLVAATGREHYSTEPGTVTIWDRNTGSPLLRIAEPGAQYTAINFLDGGRQLFTATRGLGNAPLTIRIWDIADKVGLDPIAMRTWSSRDGAYTTKARLVGVVDDRVQLTLAKANHSIDVAITDLSEADQQYVREQHGRQIQRSGEESASSANEAYPWFAPAPNEEVPTPPDSPIVDLSQRKHDFGAVLFGMPVSHDFLIRNVGNHPLRILEAGPEDNCLHVDFDEEVAPGGVGSVSVSIDTRYIRDRFSKTVTVTTDDANQPKIELEVIGSIRDADRASSGLTSHGLVAAPPLTNTAGRANRVPSSGGSKNSLVFSEPNHDFGTLPQGVLLPHMFYFRNAGKQAVTIHGIQPSHDDAGVGFWSPIVLPGGAGSITVILNTRSLKGPVVRSFSVTTADSNEPPIQLQLTGKVSTE